MKNRIYVLLILGFLLAKSASAQGGTGAMLDQELFSAFGTVINSTGFSAQDSAWPGYRLLDANGIMRVLSDVTGPAAPLASHSTSSQILWSGLSPVEGNFRIQTRYADFGATCDLNNPDRAGINDASLPLPNYANAVGSPPPTFQSGHFNTCGGNAHFSQNTFSPAPLTTRAAWMYRVCRRLGAAATSAQITSMVERLKVPDPTPTPTPGGPGGGILVDTTTVALDGPNMTDPALTYNWCNRISAPTEPDYQSLFRAFYPGRNIPQRIDPTRSQLPPVRAGSRGSSISPTAAWMTGASSQAKAQWALPNVGISTAPQYREHLMELVAQSDQHIEALPSSGANRWQALEDSCLPSFGSPQPTKYQVKAVAAWRAMLITMCLDPGWQVQ
jgi:hypothetical protein